jgi:Icc-related predicted phosphoesterase
MTRCLFVSDLHGDTGRYEKLLRVIGTDKPQAVFIGGDLLPSVLQYLGSGNSSSGDFVRDYMLREFRRLQQEMKDTYPRIFVIMGNDDGRFLESSMVAAESDRVWEYVHMRKVLLGQYPIYGYSYVPPTPFLLKDWEKYDVSRFVDPGCIAPEEGKHSVPPAGAEQWDATIKDDLDRLAGNDDFDRAVFLFHAPPYDTNLDRAALNGKKIDHVPLDPHVGSIAIRRFIEARQPLLTLHGHVHESARLTHSWRDRIGRTFAFSAAYDGPELALVRFGLEDLDPATRDLV